MACLHLLQHIVITITTQRKNAWKRQERSPAFQDNTIISLIVTSLMGYLYKLPHQTCQPRLASHHHSRIALQSHHSRITPQRIVITIHTLHCIHTTSNHACSL